MGKVVTPKSDIDIPVAAPESRRHIPRPRNAFILFRSLRAAEEKEKGLARRPRQANYSKKFSDEWHALSEEQKTFWRVLSDEEKRRHKLQFPDYVYSPRPKRKKTAGKEKGRGSSPSTVSSDLESRLSQENSPVSELVYPFPATRAIVPIDRSNSSSSQQEQPFGSLEHPYEAPSEFGPPPSISATLKGKQSWGMQSAAHSYQHYSPTSDYSSSSGFSPINNDFFAPPLCLDPALFSPNPAGLEPTNYMAPQPIVLTGDEVLNNQAGITLPMLPLLDQHAGPSSPSYTPPDVGPTLYAPSLAHKESVLLESLCRRTADHLAATRLPPGVYSPPLGRAHPISFASNPALLPALFEMMTGFSHKVCLF